MSSEVLPNMRKLLNIYRDLPPLCSGTPTLLHPAGIILLLPLNTIKRKLENYEVQMVDDGEWWTPSKGRIIRQSLALLLISDGPPSISVERQKRGDSTGRDLVSGVLVQQSPFLDTFPYVKRSRACETDYPLVVHLDLLTRPILAAYSDLSSLPKSCHSPSICPALG